MKDFNILNIAGKVLSKSDLKEKAQFFIHQDNWEGDFWRFIHQWLNDKDYIEVHTSGSTSTPKNIQLLKEKMLASAAMTCAYFDLKKNDKALLCLSTQHIGGMMMVVRAFYAQLNLIIVEPKANPIHNLTEVIDFTAMVPYQAQTSIIEAAEKMILIKNIIIGGGKIAYELETLITKHKINAYSTFGMTETISHIALQKIGKEKHYTCLNNIEIEKSDEDTLIINAPNLLETKLQTNDIIDLISNKEFIWLGRKDFAIETGGIKVLPEVIEKKLETFITQRFIISSIPSKQFNNEVILIIEGEKHEIDSNIFSELDKFEKPKSFFFVKQFVETANGKIKRLETTQLIS